MTAARKILFASLLMFAFLSAHGEGPETLTPHVKPRSLHEKSCKALLAIAGVATKWAGIGERLFTDKDNLSTAYFRSTERNHRMDVFVIGDSLSCGEMSFCGGVRTILATRMPLQRGWAINAREKIETLEPLFDRLAKTLPTRVTVAARSGAYMNGASPLDRTVANVLGNISNFSDQVDRLLKKRELPNLVLVWIGHNNLDWAYDLEHVEHLEREKYLTDIPTLMADNLEQQLNRIRERSASAKEPTRIVVFGLLNLENMAVMREQARLEREANPEVFHYFEVPYTHFPSVRPEHQDVTVNLGRRVNEALNARLEEMRVEGCWSETTLRFSNALFHAPLTTLEMLHPKDGFHLSAEGHNVVADAIFNDLEANGDLTN